MNFSELFIRRPVMTILVMASIAILGLVAYSKLAVSDLPDVNYPTINVTVSYPGASPETMANSVALPLEKEFMAIPGISEIISTNLLGNTTIALQFNIDQNIDFAAQDVEAAISRAKTNLPRDLPNEPVYRKVNPADTPIIYLALTSTSLEQSELYKYAFNYVGQQVARFPGVAEVTVYGSPFAVRIQVDPGSLASKGITLVDVGQAVALSNPYLPTGQIDGDFISKVINVDGQLVNADEYNPLIVAYKNQGPVRISDVGQAVNSVQNDRFNIRYIDKEKNQAAAVVAIQRQPGANAINVTDAIKNYLPTILNELPGSVDLKVIFDRSESIRESVEEVEFTLFLAFILVVLVIYLYLGQLTETIIPSLVLPMSIIATFVVMYWKNYTIDNLSLLAFTLAIGFIIDDAIVVLENIVQHIEKGATPFHAAIEGSRQITFTIISMTLSLVAVFIPLLFMGGLIGKIFQQFSVILMVVTLASGIISLTLTPMLSSRFLKARAQDKKNFVERFADRLNQATLNWYAPKLKKVLPYRWTAVGLLALFAILVILLFKTIPTNFIPNDDIGFITTYSQAAEGTSSFQMNRYQSDLVNLINSNPEVESIVSLGAYPQNREGINFIRLVPKDQRKTSFEFIYKLYQQIATLPGFNTYVKNVPLIDLSIGSVNRAEYQFVLQSFESEPLYKAAQELIDQMKKDPIFLDVSSDLAINTPQINMKILRDKAYTLGVDASDIENTLLLGYSGNRVSRIQSPINQYDVIVELLKPLQKKASSLDLLYVKSKLNNNLVPLNAVAEWSEGIGPSSITHLSQLPAVNINFNVQNNVPLSTALDRLREIADEILPTNVRGYLKGSAESFEASIKSSAYLLFFAVVAIYIILGILYESFIHPITILTTLLPAILGGLATLWILGIPLSLYGYLGLILLIGIVKKNGIMMVDYALDNIREKGQNPEEAIYHAALARLRPIMMTTIAAIFGAIPIAFALGTGALSRKPLGFVIIGGLLFSQVITLFITPIIFLILDKFNRKYAPKILNE
ncbi:MAG: hypothetical protein BGO10_07680 [Chlamydia sp. 32-24]|nr:MAG: hypothetical protein BGO10_07680 [Chlamydia sp. 32-24]